MSKRHAVWKDATRKADHSLIDAPVWKVEGARWTVDGGRWKVEGAILFETLGAETNKSQQECMIAKVGMILCTLWR